MDEIIKYINNNKQLKLIYSKLIQQEISETNNSVGDKNGIKLLLDYFIESYPLNCGDCIYGRYDGSDGYWCKNKEADKPAFELICDKIELNKL